jgi:hypothetical protein
MTPAELYQALAILGLPVAYHHFIDTPENPAPVPPYIVYLEADSDAWGSDERNEIKRVAYLVELYTLKKDLENQASLESLFNERGIRFGCIEAYIDSEKLYQAAYTIEFISKVRR